MSATQRRREDRPRTARQCRREKDVRAQVARSLPLSGLPPPSRPHPTLPTEGKKERDRGRRRNASNPARFSTSSPHSLSLSHITSTNGKGEEESSTSPKFHACRVLKRNSLVKTRALFPETAPRIVVVAYAATSDLLLELLLLRLDDRLQLFPGCDFFL